MLPHIEAGKLRLIGELDPKAYEYLLQQQPRLRTASTILKLDPATEEQTRTIARSWARMRVREEGDGDALLDPETLDAALELAQQYVGDRALPGGVIDLLEPALAAREDTGDDQVPLT